MRISKDPQVRRQEIIDAAGMLFQNRGTAKTSITEIARSLGIAKGLIYYYFSSKDELVEAVINDFTASLDQDLARIRDKTGLDFAAKMKSILQLYFDAIQSHPAILTFTPEDQSAFALLKEKLFAIAYERVRPILHDAIEAGLLKLDFPDYMLKILIRGLGDLYIEGVRDLKIHAALIEQTLGLSESIL